MWLYWTAVQAVGVRELKNRLSEYLRAVREGQRVLVTDRGRVVAELRAADATSLEQDLHPGLAQLARRGVVSVGAPNQSRLYPRLKRLLPLGKLKRLLAEERGEH